jgi:hypothetical protein
MKRRRGWGAPRSIVGLVAPAVAIVMLLSALTILLGGCGSSSESGAAVSPAPTFSGKTLAGDEISLGGYRGRPLVLAFMASW